MHSYYLSQHVYACRTGGFTVLLDLENDRYLALDDSSTTDLMGIVEGMASVAASAVACDPTKVKAGSLVREMEAKNILTRDRKLGKAFEFLNAPPAVKSIVDDDLWNRPAVPFRELILFALAVSRAALLLRTRSLKNIVLRVQHRRCDGDGTNVSTVKKLVTAFEALQPFVFVSRDACLFHALALIEFLALHRVAANWVFGVRAMPFSAHCWVQHGDTVLNDDPDNVRRYRPIMVV